MPIEATVLVPTHDHGPLVRYSVSTALRQTVADIEVFIVGDGVPDVTRDIAADLTRGDERVRFFDNPKGDRHGETHRHAALAEARGRIVCYLADDDLWATDHIETMGELLREHNFAHALPLLVHDDGALNVRTVDLTLPFYRGLLLSGVNQMPLASGGHTLELYRQLPFGWRTTPEGTPTDLYMWQQVLSSPHCRPISGSRPTVFHFPSPQRRDWTSEQRIAELERWSRRLATGDAKLYRDVLEAVVTNRARLATSSRGMLPPSTRGYPVAGDVVRDVNEASHWLDIAREDVGGLDPASLQPSQIEALGASAERLRRAVRGFEKTLDGVEPAS